MKKVCKIILSSLFIMMSFMSPVLADEGDVVRIDENGYEYLIDNDGKHHEYYDAFGNRLSVEEALTRLNNTFIEENNNSEKNIISRGPVIQGYEFNLVGSSVSSAARQKVSANLVGPGTISVQYSVTTTMSYTGTGTVTINNLTKHFLTVNLGLEVNYSTSSEVSNSYSYSVPSGKTGAIYFTPLIQNRSVTALNTDTNQLYYVYVHSPKKIATGFTDGTFELITW